MAIYLGDSNNKNNNDNAESNNFALTLPNATLRYPTLPYPTLPYPTLPYPTLSYPTLTYPTLPYPTLPYPTVQFPTLPTLPFPTLRYPTQPYTLPSTFPHLTLVCPILPSACPIHAHASVYQLIRRSGDVLRFLCREGALTVGHLDIIWAAGGGGQDKDRRICVHEVSPRPALGESEIDVIPEWVDGRRSAMLSWRFCCFEFCVSSDFSLAASEIDVVSDWVGVLPFFCGVFIAFGFCGFFSFSCHGFGRRRFSRVFGLFYY